MAALNPVGATWAVDATVLAALLLDKDGAFAPQWDDEILKAAVVVREGAVVHPALAPKDAAPVLTAPGS